MAHLTVRLALLITPVVVGVLGDAIHRLAAGVGILVAVAPAALVFGEQAQGGLKISVHLASGQ